MQLSLHFLHLLWRLRVFYCLSTGGSPNTTVADMPIVIDLATHEHRPLSNALTRNEIQGMESNVKKETFLLQETFVKQSYQTHAPTVDKHHAFMSACLRGCTAARLHGLLGCKSARLTDWIRTGSTQVRKSAACRYADLQPLWACMCAGLQVCTTAGLHGCKSARMHGNATANLQCCIPARLLVCKAAALHTGRT